MSVLTLTFEESKQETVDEYATELDRTYSGFCEKLMLPTEYRVCTLTVQCLNLLLQKEVSRRNKARLHFCNIPVNQKEG